LKKSDRFGDRAGLVVTDEAARDWPSRRILIRLLLLWIAALAAVHSVSSAGAQDGASAGFLLPACRLYLQSEARGSRLLLERGVCLGTVETVLRIHRELSASVSFCPPPRVTLDTAVRVVVEFVQSRDNLERPLAELALEAYRQKWPC
jgi:Rap1a immunity proteins